jgi:hypothetical protein
MPIDRDDELENGRARGGLSDMMKKALFAGIGAVFMTEESVRSYVSDAKLPREIRNYIIQNTTQAKEQFFGYLSKELSQVLLRSDLPKVIQKFLADHTIELEAKIRFKSNGAPEVSGGARALPLPPQASTTVPTTPAPPVSAPATTAASTSTQAPPMPPRPAASTHSPAPSTTAAPLDSPPAGSPVDPSFDPTDL